MQPHRSSLSAPATLQSPLRPEQQQIRIFTGEVSSSELSSSAAPPPPPPPPSSSSTLRRLFASVSISLREASFSTNDNMPLHPSDCAVRRCLNLRKSSDGSQDASFTDFAPLAFEKVRRAYGVSDLELKSSLDATDLDSIKGGAGKSGAFFLLTSDSRFVVKTLTKEEKETLLKILFKYVGHVVGTRNTTLLPFFLGCYRMRVGANVVRIVVMQNMLPPPSASSKLAIFDLKGSTHNRSAGKDAPVRKDLDWLEDKKKITLHEACHQRISRGMKDDSRFLAEVDIMDYSLLLAIQTTTMLDRCLAPLRRLSPSSHLLARPLRSAPPSLSSECYYIGIIDILQEYNTKKITETAFKTLMQGPQLTLSSVEPMTYRDRFEKFMNASVFG